MLNRTIEPKIGDNPGNVIYKNPDQNALLDKIELNFWYAGKYRITAYLTQEGKEAKLHKEFEKMGFKQQNKNFIIGHFEKNDNRRISDFLNILEEKCVLPSQLRSSIFQDFKLDDPAGIDKAYTQGAATGALASGTPPLPPEIGHHIGSFLDRKTGGRLAQTSKTATETAEEMQKKKNPRK